MTLPTLPTWSEGGVLTSAQLNQIKNAIQDGTLDINTKALEAEAITQKGESLATESHLLNHVGHGWYSGLRTEDGTGDSAPITINSGEGVTFSLHTITETSEDLTYTQGTSPMWDISTESVDIKAKSGECTARVSFSMNPEQKDCAFGFYAIIPDPLGEDIPGFGNGIIISAETRSVGKDAKSWRTVSFSVPFFVDERIRDVGIQFFIENNEDSAGRAGYIQVCNEAIAIQQFGGAL